VSGAVVYVQRGFRPLLAISSRLAGVQLAQAALTTTDLVVMGWLGVDTVAAGGLAALLYNNVRSTSVAMAIPASNLVARAVGHHEAGGELDETRLEAMRDEVRAVVRAAFAVATITGIAAATLVILIGLSLPWFGQEPTIVAVALQVIVTLAPGLVPMLWMQVLRQYAVGMHHAGSLLWVTIAAIGVNLALDGGFVYGWFGMPVIGVSGIGLATSLVHLLSFLTYLVIVMRDPVLRPALSLRGWQADRRRVREIIGLGIPLSLTYASESGIISVATLIMGTFGPVALAAHNVLNNITYIAYQLSMGISQGASTLVSRFLGRVDLDEPARIAWRAFALFGIIQVASAALYLSVPRPLLELFLGSHASAVYPVAESLFVIAIIHQIAKGGQNISVGLMRGLGNSKIAFRSSLVGYWCVGVPTILLCAYVFDWRALGVWLGMSIGAAATGAPVLRRFIQIQAARHGLVGQEAQH
jgi:MATE family, multidrug efflux pump